MHSFFQVNSLYELSMKHSNYILNFFKSLQEIMTKYTQSISSGKKLSQTIEVSTAQTTSGLHQIPLVPSNLIPNAHIKYLAAAGAKYLNYSDFETHRIEWH